MYSVDTNSLMNWAVGIILAIGVGLLIVSAVRSLYLGKRSPFLNMLTSLFACFAFVVGILGFRGQASGDRPWHFCSI